MSSPFKTPEFLKLFKQWNERLRQSGFIDAEDFNLPEPGLKDWHSNKWIKPSASKSADSQKTYYELATDLLNNGFIFKGDLHKRTWELHCQGKSVRQIEDILQYQLLGYKGCKKTNVGDVIAFIRKASGIKND